MAALEFVTESENERWRGDMTRTYEKAGLRRVEHVVEDERDLHMEKKWVVESDSVAAMFGLRGRQVDSTFYGFSYHSLRCRYF